MASVYGQRHVLITGANQGIGYHTALQLCAKGYHVTLACRDLEHAERAAASISSRLGKFAAIDTVVIDLCRLSSVKKCAAELISRKCHFDVIVLNAGVLLPKNRLTKDGFDMTFQVNYLSHYYLLNELLGVATPRSGVKVVTLTSILYKFLFPYRCVSKKHEQLREYFSPIDMQCSGWRSYARSKLAAAMLACYLSRIDGVEAVSVHPGIVNTSLSCNVSPVVRKILHVVRISKFLSPVEDAAHNVVAAVENRGNCINAFRNGCKYSTVSAAISAKQNAANLMVMSREMITGAVEQFNVNSMLNDCR